MNNVHIMVTSPHQKVVVTKKTLSDAEHTYSKTNIEAMLTAAMDLSDNAFKLYARMNLHQNNYTYALSPMAIKDEIGMSAGKYRSAVKELTLKGYLVLDQGKKNFYSFYEYPKQDCADIVDWDIRENSVDQVAETEDHGSNLVGHMVDVETSSAENHEMESPIQLNDGADSNREIEQDIIRNTTEDNTRNIQDNTEEDIIGDVMKSISFSSEPSLQELLARRKRALQFEQARRDYEVMISYVDPDDRHCYDHLNPDRDVPFGIPDSAIDWDDPELPF